MHASLIYCKKVSWCSAHACWFHCRCCLYQSLTSPHQGHRPLRPKKKVLIEAPNVAVHMGALWRYNPYKWPYKWVTGVISPYLWELWALCWIFLYEAGRPPECSSLLIYEIEISQVITSFHHHIKTWNLTIYFNASFPEVNLFHLNQLAFII